MKLSQWKKKKLDRAIARLFGKGTPWNRQGDFCFVHLDAADASRQQSRSDTFNAAEFFDVECPHCRPFLEDGAIMVYTEDDLMGIRLLDSGMVETVMLRKAMATAN
jgi:hypothetical protein